MKHNLSINCSGIVPLSKKAGEWKVFLIQHRGYEQYWGYPKGHLEPNESHQEAARRELREETGLEVSRFLHQEPILEEYYFTKKSERILKRILFYVAEVEGEIRLQPQELSGGQWFSISEAMEKIIHPEGKETLQIAQQILMRASQI